MNKVMLLGKDVNIVCALKISYIPLNSTFQIKNTGLGYYATEGNVHYFKKCHKGNPLWRCGICIIFQNGNI